MLAIRSVMQLPLVTTKLYFPPTRQPIVPRPRLIERLQVGLTGPFTLISAPAGFGKTTLLSEWRAGPGTAWLVAWLSLATDDNDLVRFLRYLLAAFENLHNGLTGGVQPLLQDAQTLDAEAVLTALINHLSDLKNESVLVLDDYHQIELPLIHDALTFLLDHLPPHLHIVLLTRSDPPLPLARLRASGLLTEIRAEHLRFTHEETVNFLERVMELNLTTEQVSILEHRSEGWIAGLKLAALSIKGMEDNDEFLRVFAGSDHYIMDYLMEEVLLRQTKRIREFLLRTSILDRLTGPLCDAVTGRTDSQDILEQVEHANLFLEPLDPNRIWYRYHHLFADLLRSRLQLVLSDVEIYKLHQRAALWLEKNGLAEKAVHHALASHDFELAYRLIDMTRPELWGRSEVTTIMAWFKKLPEDFLRIHPDICGSFASGLIIGGELQEAERWLEVIETLPQKEPPKQIAPLHHYIGTETLRSVLARFRGQYEQAVSLSQQLIFTSNEDARVKGIRLLFHGHAQFYAGNTQDAERVLSEAVQVNRLSGHEAAYLNSTHHLAQLRILQGRLREARAIYESAIDYAKSQEHPVYVGVEKAGLGDLFREWNDLTNAHILLEDGLRLADRGGDVFFRLDANRFRFQLALAEKDWQTASACILSIEQISRRGPIPVYLDLALTLRARLDLARGDLEGVSFWVQTCGLDPNGPFTFSKEYSYLTLARFLIAGEQFAQAESLLNRLLTAATSAGRTGRLAEIYLLLAIACQDENQSLQHIIHALGLAEPEGYIRLFVNEGRSASDVLSRARKRKIHTEYIVRLLNAYSGESKPVVQVDVLSQREVELLRLVAAGKSNKEIAADMVISLGTVKRHITNIFTKMDVKSRTEAVARGRDLNLL